MEFQGRIKKVLPLRSGTSQKGEWKALPFVFEYFEHDTDRYADSVILETFDTKVIENLKEGMEVVCGWSHKAKDIKKQNGEEATINELRLYKIESVRKAAQNALQQANVNYGVQSPTPQPNGGQEEEKADDLPF